VPFIYRKNNKSKYQKGCKAGIKKEVYEMKTLKEISKWLRGTKGANMSFAPGIDSHKWESQMEIRHLISSRPDARVISTLRNDRTCTT
jgi:hypothetical protein